MMCTSNDNHSSSTPHTRHNKTLQDDDDDDQQQHQQATTWTYVYAFCAALNSINLGYDIGVSTNAGPKIAGTFDLTDAELELFLGSLNFWTIFGALISPVVTDRYGRRATFIAASMGFLLGIALQVTAGSFDVVLFGRMIVGVGVGVGEAVDPMYISEISPPQIRGQLVSWAEAGVSFGVVLGFASSLLVYSIESTNAQWRCMLAGGAVLPLVMVFLVMTVLPESPRWLMAQQQESAARVVLSRVYPPNDIDEVIDNMKESLELEDAAAQAVGWAAIVRPSPAVRRTLVVGVGIAILQQACGIDAVMFYLMYVIQGTGIHSEIGQIAALITLGMVKLLFVFVGANLFDRLGRRPLLFTSLIGCAASLGMVSLTFMSDSNLSKIMTVLGLASYLAFFSTGLGPGNWVVVSEIFALSIRAKAMSVAILPNRMTATIMASSFLSLSEALTWPGFFLVLAGICLFGAGFLYMYLPETKGKTLEEMAVYFAELTGDRSILDVEELLRAKKQGAEIELPEMEIQYDISSGEKASLNRGEFT